MISIIVPAYNIEKYIARCIESILCQKYKEWELIIVDDGSTDHTWNVILDYAKKDRRIKAIHKENAGVSSARNLGLDFSSGEYISFIDGDDWIEPDLYEDAMKVFKLHCVDIFMFEYYIDSAGKSTLHHVAGANYGIINTEDCLIHTIRPHNRFACSKVISSKLLLNRQNSSGHIRYNSSITHGEDTLFIIEAILNSQKTYYTDKAYYHYEQREGSAVLSKFTKSRLSGLRAYAKINDLLLENLLFDAYEYGCGACPAIGGGLQATDQLLKRRRNAL